MGWTPSPPMNLRVSGGLAVYAYLCDPSAPICFCSVSLGLRGIGCACDLCHARGYARDASRANHLATFATTPQESQRTATLTIIDALPHRGQYEESKRCPGPSEPFTDPPGFAPRMSGRQQDEQRTQTFTPKPQFSNPAGAPVLASKW